MCIFSFYFCFIGINTVVAPMYLSEVAPVNLRGSLGTLNQLGIVSGILISQVLGLSKVSSIFLQVMDVPVPENDQGDTQTEHLKGTVVALIG